MTEKKRIDTELVRRGLAESREKAQAAIMAGIVYIGQKKILKPSETVQESDEITVREPAVKYVSRGALKLEKAIRVFGADLRDRVVMDIGASTGGFTDVCLRNGARRVYSIDVGYGQLDWKLRNDPRVTVMERTNARYLDASAFDEHPTVTVMDVSFISICLILPVAIGIMGDEGVIYTLIKPQFEAGRGKVGKNGVVRDSATHEEVLNGIVRFAEQLDWPIRKMDYSPITGPKGNIEFIAEMRKKAEEIPVISSEQVRDLVREAHAKMDHPV